MTRGDADRIRRREDRRVSLLVAEHRYRTDVRRDLERSRFLLPHDSSPSIPLTDDGRASAESENR